MLHQEIAPVHVSGHGYAEEIRTIHALLRPRNVMPIHGEFRMLAAQARLAQEGGARPDRARRERLRGRAGGNARIVDKVEEAGHTFVDGLGVGDVREVALRDRRHLSEDGVLIVVVTIGSQNGARSPRRR